MPGKPEVPTVIREQQAHRPPQKEGFFIADKLPGVPLYRRGMSEFSNPSVGYMRGEQSEEEKTSQKMPAREAVKRAEQSGQETADLIGRGGEPEVVKLFTSKSMRRLGEKFEITPDEK